MKKRDAIFTVLFFVIIFSIFYISNKNEKNNLNNFKIEEFTNNEISEADFVSGYIKQNIKSIATNQPVLGGSWYTVSVSVDPTNDSGSVVYEDGHIQSSASFKYVLGKQNITIVEFKILN